MANVRRVSALFAAFVLAIAQLHVGGHAIALPWLTTSRLQAGASRVPSNFNINSGGPAIGRFIADDYKWIVGKTSAFQKPDAQIGGAELKNLPMYKSHRYGTTPGPWGYDIPVSTPGTYGCTVHFAETESSAFAVGARVFDLSVATTHGKPVVFKGIDVFKELKGAQFTALTKTATKLVIRGVLSVRVVAVAGSKHPAFISGITCERTGDLPAGVKADLQPDSSAHTHAAHVPLPFVDAVGTEITGKQINVNCGFGKIGRFQAEDARWIFKGQSTTVFFIKNQPIGGAEAINAPALWSHRYGVNGAQFGYNIPVGTSGIWDCSLHFAEIDSSKKIGQRVFDIQVQDRQITGVDVLAAAKGAKFTSVVRTFVNVPIQGALVIRLKASAGDPFLSAITCAWKRAFTAPETAELNAAKSAARGKGAEVSAEPELSPAADAVPSLSKPPSQPLPDTIAPSAVPEPEPDLIPSPGFDGSSVTDPVPTPTGEPHVIIASFPSQSPEDDGRISPSRPPQGKGVPPGETPVPSPGVDSKSEVPGESPSPTPNGTPSVPVKTVDRDAGLTAGEGQVVQKFDLILTTPVSVLFDNKLKKAMIDMAVSATEREQWAMVKADKLLSIKTATRQAGQGNPSGSESRYSVVLEAVLPKDSQGLEALTKYSSYVSTGKGDTFLAQRGYKNSKVRLANPPDTNAFKKKKTKAEEQALSSNAPTIVAAVVGSLLGVLVIVLILTFFVIHRHRRNEVNPEAFDAPPPAMTDSEMDGQSTIARTETNASVEYLDDDSTFTAATSRAGDPESGMTLDKDVWGRGSS